MIDNHAHVGWFTDGYHSPREVWQAEQDAGIDEFAVSSTSTCAELYKLVVREMREIIRLGGSRVHPILWLTPRMLKTWGLSYMLHSKIRWQGVKLHWEVHKEWFYNQKLLHNALEVAKKLQVPVLLHTGNSKECHANVFLDVCKQYDTLDFILAHARPIDETKNVLNECNNVYVDTAFMSSANIKELVDDGYSRRILYGTDAPINLLFYKEMSTVDYLKNNMKELQDVLSPKEFETIITNKLYS